MSTVVVDAVEHLVRGIVDNPDDVRVDMVTSRRGRTVEVHVHPDDATRLGIAHGAEVQVKSEAGAIVLPAEVTDAVRPGVVSIPHGWGHNVEGVRMATAARNGGANSNVLARTDLFDPLSGNAVLNGIPVEVSATN